jgi:hypothetical protein
MEGAVTDRKIRYGVPLVTISDLGRKTSIEDIARIARWMFGPKGVEPPTIVIDGESYKPRRLLVHQSN